ncbi:hypothetical protein PIB30_095328 [Stylosanthes scabra]|uniref:Protein kinase domain-containing protein n=1 Tax=Stylosanthes scabra TaxID=79078 RepID=A0ABU6RW97_9FABA|nr:hypothetical protein [Stylosanthes scabra]
MRGLCVLDAYASGAFSLTLFPHTGCVRKGLSDAVDYKGNDFKATVFEFMSNGSLETLLHNNIEDSESTNPSLNLIQRVNIALDVAFALDYLHNDSSEGVVHCDIKPSNVLLDDDMVAHLGDFGLARLIHDATSHSNKHGAGGSVSIERDMYNYGILLLEMITGKKPTDSMFGEYLAYTCSVTWQFQKESMRLLIQDCSFNSMAN